MVLGMSWQTDLEEILAGYFGDQTLEAGVEEMVFVTESNKDYHQRYLSAIEAGIKAALEAKLEIVQIIKDSNAWYVKGTADAGEFLQRLRSEYLSRYAAATENDI
jgi:hypothetical protein